MRKLLAVLGLTLLAGNARADRLVRLNLKPHQTVTLTTHLVKGGSYDISAPTMDQAGDEDDGVAVVVAGRGNHNLGVRHCDCSVSVQAPYTGAYRVSVYNYRSQRVKVFVGNQGIRHGQSMPSFIPFR